MTDNPYSYEATSRTAQAGNITIHYHEAGQGEVLIPLHGGGPGASAWSNWKQNLPALAQHFRVLLVDQPGYGRSDKPVIEGGMWTYLARAVKDLMDTLGIEKASFIGNSLGGGTTLKFALDYPERVNRLILMGPAGGMLPILHTTPTEGIKVLNSFYLGDGPSKEKMQQVINTLAYDPSKVSATVLEERYADALEPESAANNQRVFETLAGISKTSHAEELWRDVHRIGHRTLITWGRDDRVLPLDGALFMARHMPDARLHVFPQCGHWAQVEQQDEFERLTVQFLTLP